MIFTRINTVVSVNNQTTLLVNLYYFIIHFTLRSFFFHIFPDVFFFSTPTMISLVHPGLELVLPVLSEKTFHWSTFSSRSREGVPFSFPVSSKGRLPYIPPERPRFLEPHHFLDLPVPPVLWFSTPLSLTSLRLPSYPFQCVPEFPK